MRRAVVALAAVVAGAAGAAACGDSDGIDENPGGLVRPRQEAPKRVDVDRAATDPAELARAAALPHERLTAAVGPHTVTGSSSLRVTTGGEQVEALDDTTSIAVEADGDYHAVLENSADYGREVYYLDGELYLRPRYGRFHRRAPTTPAEPQAILDDMFATLGDYFELVSAGAVATDAGEIDYQGRAARKLTLARAPKQRDRDEPLPQRAWRESIAVGDVAGELVLDAETGAPLAGHVKGTVSFVREGTTYEMAIEARHEVSLGAPPAIEPPEEELTVALPPSSRELEDRDALLDGIAAPAGARKPKPLPEGAPRVWRKRQLKERERQRLLEEAEREQQEAAP